MLAYNVYLCHQVAEIRPDKAAPLEDDDVPTTLCFSSRCALPMLWRSSSCKRLQESTGTARYGLLVPACSLAYFAISSSPARRLSLSLSLSLSVSLSLSLSLCRLYPLRLPSFPRARHLAGRSAAAVDEDDDFVACKQPFAGSMSLSFALSELRTPATSCCAVESISWPTST